MGPSDPWHYNRAWLASDYLAIFELELFPAQVRYASRRMGKSEFLQQDLVPVARQMGFLPAYVDLSCNRAAPAEALCRAIAAAIGSPDSEQSLTDLIRGFGNSPRQLLLVIDEVQLLAEPLHVDLAYTLRAHLDTHNRNIKVFLLGNCEPTLRNMMQDPRGPFYHWGFVEPLRSLDYQFVLAVTELVNRLTRYPLKDEDALEAFAALHRQPDFFRRYLNRYLQYAQLGSEAALQDTLARAFPGENFVALWDELLPADREIVKLLVGGVRHVYSEFARDNLGFALGVNKAVGINIPQKALQRLQSRGVVARVGHGRYRVQDHMFVDWVRRYHRWKP